MREILFLLFLLLVYIGLGCENPNRSLVQKVDKVDKKEREANPVVLQSNDKNISKKRQTTLNHQEIVALLEEQSFYEPAYNICLPKEKNCRMKDFFVKQTFKSFDENTTSINYTSEFIYSEDVLLLNKVQEVKLKDDKLFYKDSKGYYKISVESEDYISYKFYDALDKPDERLDKRVYFELEKAEEYYRFLKENVAKDFKALMAGKRFYYLQEGKFLVELSFDKEFTSSTGVVIAGEDIGHQGTAHFTIQGRKFQYENGGYMELVDMSEEYLSFSLYTDENPDDSMFVKMFFDKAKAEAYFDFFAQ